MSRTVQRMFASRAASTLLALLLFAGITAPFLILQSTHVFAASPALPCTEGNHNGCTELSATPPEDIPSVPPNLVLMMDDSGSMAWDYMPDWTYLSDSSDYGTRNAGINAMYYNPLTTYTPPPKAIATGTTWQSDGTWYPNSPGLTAAYTDGFAPSPTPTTNIVGGSGYVGGGNGNSFNYTENLPTTEFTSTTVTDKGLAVWNAGSAGNCTGGYYFDPTNPAQCIRNPVSPSQVWTCNPGDGNSYNDHGVRMCHHYTWNEGKREDSPYQATNGGLTCPGGTTGPQADNLCHYPPKSPTSATPAGWVCPSGGTFSGSPAPPPSAAPHCWASSGGSRIYVRAFTYVVGTPVKANAHFVVPNAAAPAGGWCAHLYPGTGSNIWNGFHMDNCVNETDTSGKAAPGVVAAGQNVANWFSYYRTRLLMAKSGLMTAFSTVDPKFRFGFASINGNGTSNIPTGETPFAFDDSTADGTGGNSNNKLAVVQPFGDGSSGTQKAKFWTWLASISGNKGTPLRKALDAVGQYYQTSQPWTAMSGDPGYTTGSTTEFACRASYTILTTDGFWNGDDPSGIGAAADSDGPIHSVPSGNTTTRYLARPPFSGGGVGGSVPSLADVATYYWENDLQTGMPNVVSAGSSDPATWQHMTTYTIGLGFKPVNIQPSGTTVKQVLGWAHALDAGAASNPTPATFSWPSPASDDVNNIADLAHAAINGRGDFFNVTNPQDLANAFSSISAQIAARAPKTSAAVNASVLALGAVTFRVGYDTSDWHGSLEAITLKTDGTLDTVLWDAGAKLDAAYHSTTGYPSRTVYTGAYTASGGGTYSAFQFNAANKTSLDSTEVAGLTSPAFAGVNDTLDNRINYLLGDTTYEGTSLDYRDRTSILGAVLHSEPVYVAGATGNYRDSWPTFGTYTPPEAVTGAQTFGAFVGDQSTRAGMVYLAANDGMLHAFNAPVAVCTGTVDSNGDCTAYTFPAGSKQGEEAWAFVPRAAYANLGNLTNLAGFKFRPTTDGTPVTRDVFFHEGGTYNNKWRTILAAGMGLGGRGVYGLDITDPSSFSATNVLWEFDADMAVVGCVTNDGTCKGTDLGYTAAQPNVGRLSNGKWVVLVPNGYFPDCGTPDYPTADTASCNAIAAQAPKDASGNPYSALFVLNAQTGKVIAELKTPTNLGVTSFGLSKPVMGDYNSDQVDDVAFAGDVQGNLWRFDMSDTDPTKWTVTLVYKGNFDATNTHQGMQPITTMPRLFPDPTTNRFLVLFGTGKYLGVGDNSNADVQAIISVRDVAGTTYDQTNLVQQFLHETVVPATLPDGTVPANAGASLRCITGSSNNDCTTDINAIASADGGWFVNLSTTTSNGTRNNAGERIVVNPGAIFASNTVIFESLITGAQNTDACNPSTQGAILALNATTGGSGGVSSLGGPRIAGGRISNARTSGSLPVVSALGGGKAYLPGVTLAPGNTPVAIDAPIWRRRSWRVLMNDQ